MITLIVPTLNRPDFIARILDYYEKVGYRHSIFIGDSSSGIHLERNKDTVAKSKNKVKVTYREYPNTNPTACFKSLLESVVTPYAAFLPDDDFFIPNGLEKCIEFLEHNPEYAGAHGIGIILNLESPGPYGKVKNASGYQQAVSREKTAAERVLAYSGNPTLPLFSIYRTAVWKRAFCNVTALADPAFTELLPSYLAIISGKIARLDCLYSVRQCHDRRYLLRDVYDWITGQEWFPSYQVFYRCVIEALMETDGIKIEEAQKIAKQAFWSYLSKIIPYKFHHQYIEDKKIGRKIKALVQGIPGGHSCLSVFRKIRPAAGGNLSLPALLKKSSPHHRDFMPIYDLITDHAGKNAV
ncbi:MAG: TIGR00180 family glycosyltransferase [Candidatus Omnitrophota bacterium]